MSFLKSAEVIYNKYIINEVENNNKAAITTENLQPLWKAASFAVLFMFNPRNSPFWQAAPEFFKIAQGYHKNQK